MIHRPAALVLAALAGAGSCGGRDPGSGGEAHPAGPAAAALDGRLSARADCADLVGVGAGSALIRLESRLLLVQDAAASVALIAPDTRAIERVILAGDGRPLAKAEKPDFEAALRAGSVVHILGSGSTPARRRIARLDLDGDRIGRIALFRADALYDALAVALGGDPNIEGAVAVGDRVRLFHRGSGASPSAIVDLPAVALDGGGPGRLEASPLELGRVRGVRLTITDAAVHGARVLYLAVAEDTPNAVDDGPIVGAAIGVLGAGVARYALISEGGRPSVRKFEGVALDRGGRTGWLVTDPDDDHRPASLCHLALDGPW